MKQLIIALTYLTLSTKVYAQQAQVESVNPKIIEVFADKTQELILDSPDRLALYNDFLENRVKVIESQKSGDDKFIKLSSVSLMNKYNATLTRDLVFDPNNFNPLKYALDILPKTTMIYRVDNTNYLIVIQPQTLNK